MADGLNGNGRRQDAIGAAPVAWRDQVVVLAAPPDADLPALAERLGLAQVMAPEQDRFLLLRDDQGRLGLLPPADRPDLGRTPLTVDFVTDPRFSRPMNLREPLARAVGLRGGMRPRVIDLTAGLGRDSWALAAVGCPVVACERQPLVHALLADGLDRARRHPKTAEIAARIELLAGDARQDPLPAGSDAEGARVWLIDPMFPERRKSALVKKAMRIFQALVGADEDAADLLAWARRQPGRRWVVKRPVQAPPLGGVSPDMTIAGSRVRFDCYLQAATAPC